VTTLIAAGRAVTVDRRLQRRLAATQRRLAATQRRLAATKRELVEARARALRDPLTGIANRAAFDAELAYRLRGAKPFAVLLIDLDRFKPINDTHGHPVGDVVLCEVARRLDDGAAFTGYLAARLGGDEFGLITGCPLALLALGLHAQPALKMVRRPISAGERTVRVSASVGVLVVRPGNDAADVMHSVDAALYRAKAAGGDQVVDFGAGPLLSAPVDRSGARLRDANPHRADSHPLLATSLLAMGVLR
jgi:diguanylate cyclase (GGDEF)-like protein